jgi:inhibitor of KinA
LPDEIAQTARLSSPRTAVPAGSVAIAGRQTAVYPSASPGGWNLIGRTPLTLVDVEDDFFPIAAGDRVQFCRIDESEFSRLEGVRLA